MVKRSADCWASAREVPTKDCFSAKDTLVAPPAPGPMTPSSACSSAMDEQVLIADVSTEGHLPFPVGNNKENCPKKMNAWRDGPLKSPFSWDSIMQVSTAASTPAATPSSSPGLRPTVKPSQGAPALASDYSRLSVPELREELGVAGTGLAAGWDKAELIGVLDYLDHMCGRDPSEPIAMEL